MERKNKTMKGQGPVAETPDERQRTVPDQPADEGEGERLNSGQADEGTGGGDTPSGSGAPEPGDHTPAGPYETLAPDELILNREYASCLPALTEAERAALEASIRAAGRCTEPIFIDRRTKEVLDGNNRVPIFRALGWAVLVCPVDLASKAAAIDWIRQHQRGRRNLTPEQDAYLRGKEYLVSKQTHGGDRRSGQSRDHAEHSKTAQRLAAKLHVSAATIRRDGQYAEAIDRIAEACGPSVKERLLAGDTRLTRQDVVDLATKTQNLEELAQQVRDVLRGVRRPDRPLPIANEPGRDIATQAAAPKPPTSTGEENVPVNAHRAGRKEAADGIEPTRPPAEEEPPPATPAPTAEQRPTGEAAAGERQDASDPEAAFLQLPADPVAFAHALIGDCGLEKAEEYDRMLGEILRGYAEDGSDVGIDPPEASPPQEEPSPDVPPTEG